MAKDTPTTPDDKKTVPAGETKNTDKTVPGKEPGKADGQAAAQKTETPADRTKAMAEAAIKREADKTKPPTSDKADDSTRRANKALLESTGETPEQAALRIANINLTSKKNKATSKPPKAEKQRREARPPTGPKEEPKPKEPEKPPEPKEAPRHGEKEEIVYLPISELHPFNTFRNHPFGVRDDAEMRDTVKSVAEIGVQHPAVVRPRENGGYEIISGHRRHKASELAGYMDMPCIIRQMDDFEAVKAMKEANRQRSEILPSEKSRLLDLELEAIKRQGARDGNGTGQRSNEIVAENNNMTVKQVQRYIKLNDLTPELMKMVDEKLLKFTPAVEIAFIGKKNQQYIASAIEAAQATPSLSQAQRMRELDQKKTLNPDVIDGIMLEEKKEEKNVIISSQELSKYFGAEKTPREMKDHIMSLLENDLKTRQKDLPPPEKKSSEQEK